MQKPRRTLLVLHDDLSFLGRLGRAVEGRFRLQRVAGWQELRTRYEGAPPATVLAVDPYLDAPLGELSEELASFFHHFPSALVVPAFYQQQGSVRHVWTLSEWGAADVLYLDEENSETIIRRRLERLNARSVQSLIGRVRVPLPGRAQSILAAAAEVVACGGDCRDLARRLALSQSTLLRWCQRSDLPAPRELVLWLRALFAAAMLDDPGHTVRSVAIACGYTDDRQLRRLLRNRVGLSPTTLRERGAFAIVEGRFLALVSSRSGVFPLSARRTVNS